MAPLDDATLEGGLINVHFGDAILNARETLSLDSAPTVTITIADPDRTLVNSRLWYQRSRLQLGPRTYVLVQIDKAAAGQLTLTFELFEVYVLRQARKYRKAYRSKIDRVTFARSLCRESQVKFHAPEVGPPVPQYQRSSGGAGSGTSGGTGGATSGFEKGAKVRVHDSPASADQLQSLSIAIDEAVRLRASEETIIGMIMAGTMESLWDRRSVNRDSGIHAGIFQQDPTIYTRPDAFDVTQAAHEFLVGPKTWNWEKHAPLTDTPKPGSFMALMRGFTGKTRTIGDIIVDVERPAKPGTPAGAHYAGLYNQWHAEARHTWAAYATPGRTGSRTTLLLQDNYEFSRGQPGRPETSWDALGRLADCIGWLRFMVGDTVWFVAPEWLFQTPSVATLEEGNGVVDAITWTLDVGKARDECDVVVNDSWIYSPGVVVTVDGEGPASGKWLISEWERDLLQPSGSLTLVKPGFTLAEPVGDQSGDGFKKPKTKTDTTTTTQPGWDPGQPPPDAKTIGGRIARWVLSYAGIVRGPYGFAYQHEKHLVPLAFIIANPHPQPPFDCSSFARWAWGAVGHIDVALHGSSDATWGMEDAAKKNPGVIWGGAGTTPHGGFIAGDLVFCNRDNHVVVMIDPLNCVSAEQPSTGIQRRPLSWHSAVTFWARWHNLVEITDVGGGTWK